MDVWILITTIIIAIFVALACVIWSQELAPNKPEANNRELKKEVEKLKENNVSLFLGFTIFGALAVLLWISIENLVTGFHWSIIIVFSWVYAAGYAWARVPLRIALKRRATGPIILYVTAIFYVILSILTVLALFIGINITRPLTSIFDPTLAALNIGAIHWDFNGYAFVGLSGLILVVASFSSLL
jgi:magnesium-transporting ATPase (P-type)